MSQIGDKVKGFSKRPSNVEHSGRVVKRVSRADIVKLNDVITPKIEQNKRKMNAALIDAHDFVVKGEGCQKLVLKKTR